VNDIEDIYTLLTNAQEEGCSRQSSSVAKSSADLGKDVDEEFENLVYRGAARRALPRIEAVVSGSVKQCKSISTSFPAHEDIVPNRSQQLSLNVLMLIRTVLLGGIHHCTLQ